jgi:hypothetical protein
MSETKYKKKVSSMWKTAENAKTITLKIRLASLFV